MTPEAQGWIAAYALLCLAALMLPLLVVDERRGRGLDDSGTD